MRRITYLTDCALAIFCILLWVPIASGQGTPYICYATYSPDSSHITHYHSGIFQTTASLQAISDGWENYLKKTYDISVNLNSVCHYLSNDPAAQRYAAQQVEQMWKGQKGEVVRVDWKYVPGQDTPPPPKPVASGTTLNCYCSAYFGPNGGENLAFSDSFEAPKGTDLNLVRDDFVKFVREKYSAKDANGGCSSEDKAKEAHNMRSKKIIETGWKPKTFPKAQPQSH